MDLVKMTASFKKRLHPSRRVLTIVILIQIMPIKFGMALFIPIDLVCGLGSQRLD